MDTQRYDQLVNHAEAYVRALNGLDSEAYIKLFAPSCTVHDPYGSGEYSGADGLRKFFDGMLKTWQFFEMRADGIYPGGENRLAMRWSVSATAKNQKRAEFSGITVFVFESNTIVRLNAYWNLRSMLKQIQEA